MAAVHSHLVTDQAVGYVFLLDNVHTRCICFVNFFFLLFTYKKEIHLSYANNTLEAIVFYGQSFLPFSVNLLNN